MEKKQADRREQIIDAAYRLLTAQGYEMTSIKDIARAAGVAPGLVHYYFASKDELLIAVLRSASERYSEEMARFGREVPADKLAALALLEPQSRLADQPGWYRLRYDLFALGLRNPALAEGVAALLKSGRVGIATLAEKATGPDVDVQALSAVLLACFDGFALQKLVDPEFDVASAYNLLSKLVESLQGMK